MAVRVRTWMWVVGAIFILCVLGVVAMAGAGFYFFSKHVQTSAASPARAASEFEVVKERFRDQKPLIELDDRGQFLRSNPGRPEPSKVRVSIPFWLLRLKLGGATVDFNGGRLQLEDMKLSVEDLERLGPALIVDHATADGERVLVWSQ